MKDLSGYRDGLYDIDESPDRVKSIELLLIRIVDALDLVMLKLDQEQASYLTEGRALQNIATALDKLTQAHIELVRIKEKNNVQK